MQVVQDFESGLEYAEAVTLKDMRRQGCSKEYLVEWADSSPDTWESEDNITRTLVSQFERQRRAMNTVQAQPVEEVPVEPVTA